MWSNRRSQSGLRIEAERRPGAPREDVVRIEINEGLFSLEVPRKRGFFRGGKLKDCRVRDDNKRIFFSVEEGGGAGLVFDPEDKSLKFFEEEA